MCGGCEWGWEEGQVFELGEAVYLWSLLCANVRVLRKARVTACWRPSSPTGLLRLTGLWGSHYQGPRGCGWTAEELPGAVTAAGSAGGRHCTRLYTPSSFGSFFVRTLGASHKAGAP